MNDGDMDDQDRDLQLLQNNLQLFQTYSQHIQSQPHLFYCSIPKAILQASWVPNYEVPLGILLMLWDNGNWMEPCPICYGILYLVGGSGSVMSGSNRCWGICLVCGLQYAAARSFLQDIYKPAARLLVIYGDNRAVVPYRESPVWSWTQKPLYVPPAAPQRPIDAVNLVELIESLKSFEGFNNNHEGDGEDSKYR